MRQEYRDLIDYECHIMGFTEDQLISKMLGCYFSKKKELIEEWREEHKDEIVIRT